MFSVYHCVLSIFNFRVVLEMIFILLSLIVVDVALYIYLGRNDIHLLNPLENIVKVPTTIRSSTELTSWEENAREGDNHPCSIGNLQVSYYTTML